MTGVAADEKKGKKKGGGEKVSGNGEPSPAALLFPFCPYRRSVIPPKPLGEAEPQTRQCAGQRWSCAFDAALTGG